MPWGAIASIASAGLGFIGSRKKAKEEKRARARDEYLNSPQGIRDEAEKAGFNPLTVLNSGRGFGAGYAPQFGNELGQLGQGLVEAATGYEQLKIQRAELDMQQQRLEHLQKATTLGEKVPGIYGARNASTKRTSGRVSGGVSANRDGSGSGLGSSSSAAPGRDVEISPFMSGAGLTEINSALTGHRPILVPGDDGEPWGIDELATGVLASIPQLAPEGAYKLVEYWDEKSGEKKRRYEPVSKTQNHLGHIAPAGIIQGAPLVPIWTTDLPPAGRQKQIRRGAYPDARSKTARKKYMRLENP